MAKSGRSQGGVIGKVNKTSFGKCVVTKITGTGCYSNPAGATRAHVLVVAGGGSGGVDAGGGAGGGGLILQTCQNFTSGACIPVTIGAGGPAAGPASPQYQTPNSGYQGNDTVFGNPSNPITATGGGAGGKGPRAANPFTPGGSGGGGAASGPGGNESGTGNTPSSCSAYGVPQGNDGGAGAGPPGEAGGGGGGAGAAGANASVPGIGTVGGAGADVTPTFGAAPQPYYAANTANAGATCTGFFAGGGGGGTYGPGSCNKAGGVGGGGKGGSFFPTTWPNPTLHYGNAGAPNSGGGGGGTGAPGGNVSGAGGSGVVLIKALDYASGMWPMQAQYNKRVQGTWPSAPTMPGFNSINLLVVAGGGGGGALQSGGGGGGGYRFCTAHPISPGNTYKITIGAGGLKWSATSQQRPGASSGVNSSFDTLGVGCTYSATGGGVGVYGGNPQPYNTPFTSMGGCACRSGPGGSGGGRGESNIPCGGALTGNKGGYPVVEGYDGGVNWSPTGQYGGTGAGGGGAGAVGIPIPSNLYGGAGGAGSSAWPGDSTLRGGGGGGGNGSAIYFSGDGGPGGGGKGGNVYPAPACNGGQGASEDGGVNLGGGAGAGGYTAPGPPLNHNGGSGVVLIQFPDAFAGKGITGGSPACGTATPGCTHTHTFNATGCFVIPF